MRSPENHRILITNAGTGGGHAYYGQTEERELQKRGYTPAWYEVRQDTHDPRARAFFEGANALYLWGSQGGWHTPVYEWIRSHQNTNNPLLKLAQRELKDIFEYYDLVISTHAYTAVQSDTPLILVEGDVHAPKDYALPQANVIVVPTEIARNDLLEYGVAEEKIATVGYFVDERVKDETLLRHRFDKLALGDHHIGILFTGALPQEHVRLVRETLLPTLAPLMRKKRIQLSVYTFTDDSLADKFQKQGKTLGLTTIRYGDDTSDGNWDMQLVYGENARNANEHLLSTLGDPVNPMTTIVTMAGERFAWIVGVPMYLFKPINKDNAGANTEYGIEQHLFPPLSATTYLAEALSGDIASFANQNKKRVFTAQEMLPTEGAENTGNIAEQLLTA